MAEGTAGERAGAGRDWRADASDGDDEVDDDEVDDYEVDDDEAEDYEWQAAPRPGWHFPEVTALVVLLALVVQFVAAVVAGLLFFWDDPEVPVSLATRVAASIEWFGSFLEPDIVIPLALVALLWWRVHHWKAEAEVGEDDDEVFESAAQLLRLHAMCLGSLVVTGLLTLAGLVVACLVPFSIGHAWFQAAGETPYLLGDTAVMGCAFAGSWILCLEAAAALTGDGAEDRDEEFYDDVGVGPPGLDELAGEP